MKAVENCSPERWDAFLDAACGEETDLRCRVRVLLEAHRKADSLLDPAAIAPDGHLADPHVEGPGTVIGPYKLLEQIGEGGMGVVYMAEQTQPVRRKVALKIIKPGMDTKQVIARFEAERQALALDGPPQHRQGARCRHDRDAAGPTSSWSWSRAFRSPSIATSTICRSRERLELFIQVCQAVQHAHQKGIIHRDIKPTNVLVTLHDGVPVPKVIDFGIAKATGQQLTDKTLFTGFAQMIGTPLYMSPEQAEMSGAGYRHPQRHLFAWACCSTSS